ncbi:DNA repair protein rad50 [Borealophlyctis nickersoniae]|nr:DNA repair protein rad50 [Borealophlyctis nickersoniae]
MARIKEVMGDENYMAALEAIESDVDDKRDTLASMKSATSMYSKFIKKYKDSKCCPLCVRGFPDREGQAFLSKLEGILARVPEATRTAEDDLASSEKRRQMLRDLQSTYDEVEKLRTTEIPNIEAKIEQYEGDRTVILSTLEDYDAELTVLRLEVQNIELLRQQVENISRLRGELGYLEGEIQKLNEDLSITGATKTVDELQREQDLLQSKKNTLRREADRLNSDSRAKSNELQAREKRVAVARQNLQEVKMQFKEREQLEVALVTHKAEFDQAQKDAEAADRKCREIDPQIRDLNAVLMKHIDEAAAKEADYMKEVNFLRQSMDKLELIDKEVSQFLQQDGEGQIRRNQAQLQTLENRIDSLKSNIDDLVRRAQKTRDEISDADRVKREIQDNQKYRKLRKESKAKEAKISQLKEQVKGHDRDSITAQHEKLSKKLGRLSEEKAGLLGEIKQMQSQSAQLKRDLNSDYKNVEDKYREELIKLKTEEMAHIDLEKYAKALDAAIMKYHSMKMEEINKIIRELWVNTYQGSDIDTIEIRSDTEGAKGKTNYNYRVVMVKGDTALDMRGRCSAGQKVLTSLIIRLALAETFGLNCGILALDEPTTNLDRDNIESLAESLANIIKLRRQQSNFQLIIITHDEEFMQLLGKSEFCDYYWRVSKDAE